MAWVHLKKKLRREIRVSTNQQVDAQSMGTFSVSPISVSPRL